MGDLRDFLSRDDGVESTKADAGNRLLQGFAILRVEAMVQPIQPSTISLCSCWNRRTKRSSSSGRARWGRAMGAVSPSLSMVRMPAMPSARRPKRAWNRQTNALSEMRVIIFPPVGRPCRRAHAGAAGRRLPEWRAPAAVLGCWDRTDIPWPRGCSRPRSGA